MWCMFGDLLRGRLTKFWIQAAWDAWLTAGLKFIVICVFFIRVPCTVQSLTFLGWVWTGTQITKYKQAASALTEHRDPAGALHRTPSGSFVRPDPCP